MGSSVIHVLFTCLNSDAFFFSPPGNEGNIFHIDEDTGNITMTKAADIVGPIILTVLVKKTVLVSMFFCCGAEYKKHQVTS